MTKSRENRLLATKKKEWDNAKLGYTKTWTKYSNKFKNNMKKAIDWFFFYKYKDKGDKAVHLFEWFIWTLVFLRVLRVI